MGLGARLRRLRQDLEDPEWVARFQRLCGVHPAAAAAQRELYQKGEGLALEEEESPSKGPRSDEEGDGERRRRQQGASPPSPALSNGVSAGHGKTQRRNSLTGEQGQPFVIRNRLLYYLFSFGTELGNELFYLSFFPFLIWNVDPFVGRRLIIIWVWVMYLGQCTKDLVRKPRPASPPVLKLEVFYNSEYSMPSTHAMSGTAIPFSILLLTYGRWHFPFLLGVGLAIAWCTLVCASRIYMGMHSILDVIAGFVYAILIIVVFYWALDIIDNFNLTYRYAPLIIIGLHLGLGIFSFTLDTWSTSRGDTAQILGSGAGIACGSHVNNILGLLQDSPPNALSFKTFPVILFGKAMLKFLLGVVILLLIRSAMKRATIPLACTIFRIPYSDVRKARQRMEVELPYRYTTYGMVGFGVISIVPCIFNLIGL